MALFRKQFLWKVVAVADLNHVVVRVMKEDLRNRVKVDLNLVLEDRNADDCNNQDAR